MANDKPIGEEQGMVNSITEMLLNEPLPESELSNEQAPEEIQYHTLGVNSHAREEEAETDDFEQPGEESDNSGGRGEQERLERAQALAAEAASRGPAYSPKIIQDAMAELESSYMDISDDLRDGFLSQEEFNAKAMELNGQAAIVREQALLSKEHEFKVREHVARANAELSNSIPGWKTSAGREQIQRVGRQVLNDYGFSDNEINSIQDPRLIKVMHDLSQAQGKLDRTEGRIAKKAREMKTGKKKRQSKHQQTMEYMTGSGEPRRMSSAEQTNAIAEILMKM